MKSRTVGHLLAAMLCMGFIYACDGPSACDPLIMPETLVAPEQVPSTERGALTADNRFFFIGGNTVYELTPQPDGAYDYQVTLQRDDCIFGGIAADGSKLYATCMAAAKTINLLGMPISFPAWTDLIRIELPQSETEPNEIAAARIGADELFPNGMAVDDKGDIYITNTMSSMALLMGLRPAKTPAIVKVQITDEASFTVQTESVLSSQQGGMSPNGLQIRGDRLWFASGSILYETQIGDSGLSSLKQIYTSAATRYIDDFAVLSDDMTLVLCEFPSMYAMTSSGRPQLTFLEVPPRVTGTVVRKYPTDASLVPSSATTIVDAQGEALYITDYFNGGLYRLDLSAN